jgi:hypothetical protein
MADKEEYKPAPDIEVRTKVSEVRVSLELWADIESRIRKAQSQNKETFFVLIGKDDIATEFLEVGYGHAGGVSFDPENVITRLGIYLHNGYKIVADLHNHLESTIPTYEERGFTQESILTPSGADLDESGYVSIYKSAKQGPYPRIIVGLINNKFISKPYIQLKELTEDDHMQMSFVVDLEDEPDELGIVLVGEIYTIPDILEDSGIIKPVKLIVS